MSGITTHVLDTATGRPASDVPVTLERERDNGWQVVGSGTTDTDGRLRTLLTESPEAGTYRITFNTGAYFPTGFFPSVTITFRVSDLGTTDTDGRLRTLLTESPEAGTYRISFNTGAYFPTGFFPSVTITFRVS